MEWLNFLILRFWSLKKRQEWFKHFINFLDEHKFTFLVKFYNKPWVTVFEKEEVFKYFLEVLDGLVGKSNELQTKFSLLAAEALGQMKDVRAIEHLLNELDKTKQPHEVEIFLKSLLALNWIPKKSDHLIRFYFFKEEYAKAIDVFKNNNTNSNIKLLEVLMPFVMSEKEDFRRNSIKFLLEEDQLSLINYYNGKATFEDKDGHCFELPYNWYTRKKGDELKKIIWNYISELEVNSLAKYTLHFICADSYNYYVPNYDASGLLSLIKNCLLKIPNDILIKEIEIIEPSKLSNNAIDFIITKSLDEKSPDLIRFLLKTKRTRNDHLRNLLYNLPKVGDPSDIQLIEKHYGRDDCNSLSAIAKLGGQISLKPFFKIKFQDYSSVEGLVSAYHKSIDIESLIFASTLEYTGKYYSKEVTTIHGKTDEFWDDIKITDQYFKEASTAYNELLTREKNSLITIISTKLKEGNVYEKTVCIDLIRDLKEKKYINVTNKEIFNDMVSFMRLPKEKKELNERVIFALATLGWKPNNIIEKQLYIDTVKIAGFSEDKIFKYHPDIRAILEYRI